MHRKLTPRSTLENLRVEAKRWLKALRAKIADARARLDRIWPGAPTSPGLRDIQHALALEHGVHGWTALKSKLGDGARNDESDAESHEKLVARFLQNACPDHHVRGAPAHVMALDTADRLLRQHPEIAHDSIYTAIVCGDLTEVERVLRDRPQAATQKSTGPYYDHARPGEFGDIFTDIAPIDWEPLLYLCFTRLSLPAASDNALAIAKLLLDHGANPNAYFMAGDSRYTPLVGVIGEGEENRPSHPRRDDLVRLLVDRGANPYDMQVTYNTHFHGDVQWYLEIAYSHAVKVGDVAPWADPNWTMFDMGGYGCGARFLLANAIDRNNSELARWILEHGANPNPPLAPNHGRHAHDAFARMSSLTLYEEALLKGSPEIAELLARHGATRNVPSLGGKEDFAAACLRLDRTRAETLLAGHPEYLSFAKPMSFAAASDRVDVVELLLDLGMSPDIADSLRGEERALHSAAYNDSMRVAKLLVERGAQIDPRETRYSATPLWFAVWGQRQRMIEFLSPLSRDVWSLAFIGSVKRLRAVLAAEPNFAKSRGDYETPLMWLPPDEARALEVAEMFLAGGADPTVRNRQGQTAADLAKKRGLDAAAAVLRSREGRSPD
jgi:ankyrin repeat protein